MGAYCSVRNDTNDIMYIKYGANSSAIVWAGIAASIVAAIATAGIATPAVAGAVGATGAGLTIASKVIDDDLKRGGYSAIQPGGVYRSEKLTLSLFLQANIVLKGERGVRTGTLDCWTGPTDDSCNDYNATQASYAFQPF
jgi:hypothetical protein